MFYVIFMIVALWCSVSEAAIIDIASCTPGAFNDAHAQAANGDTLLFPSCNVTAWNNVVITKGVKVKGQGILNTKIKSNNTNGLMFQLRSGPGADPATIDGFSICCMSLEGVVAGTEQGEDRGIEIMNGTNFTIHDMKLFHFGKAITVWGNPTKVKGVIYDNYFYRNAKYLGTIAGYGIEIRGNATLNNPFRPPLTLNSPTNTYIENNTFEEQRHSVEAQNSGRYVFRYNTIINNREDSSAIDAHGKTTAWPRGTAQYEIYHNTITNAANRPFGVGIRGGDGVIYNNHVIGATREIALWNEDSAQVNNDGCNCTTYPCFDQTVFLYAWGNTNATGPVEIELRNACDSPTELFEGRDYFNQELAGYVAARYPYPHPGREDPPIVTPAPPTIFHVAPLP